MRDGVHWHDGKPFTADDVVYSFKAWSSPSNFANPNVATFVDFKGLRKRDRLTVDVPLVRPCAQFPSLFTFLSVATWIVPDGSSAKELARRPIGTGPFKFVSFTPGQQSVFEANRDYWEHGKPYVDRLVVDSSFTSSTALVNALLSGADQRADPASVLAGEALSQFSANEGATRTGSHRELRLHAS